MALSGLRMSRTVWVVMAGLATLAGLVACGGTPAAPAPRFEVFAPDEREPAPELTGELVDGSGAYDPAVHEGKVLVVNFWGSWCGPCLGEAPELEAVYAAHKDSGLQFLGISVRDERDNARAFAAQYTTYPSIFDKSSRVALGFDVHPNAVPDTFVIDRQGRVAAIARGPIIQSDLEPVVAQLLDEAG